MVADLIDEVTVWPEGRSTMTATATFDLSTFIQWLPIAICLIITYLLREMWEHIKQQKKRHEEIIEELTATQLDVAKNYVSYERFQDFRRDILEVMHRIEDKIEKKSPKS